MQPAALNPTVPAPFNVWRATVSGARAFTPGIVPRVPGRVNERLAHHPSAVKTAWIRATTSFAVMQALAAYGLSFVFATSGRGYAVLLAIGVAVLALALAVDLLASLRTK
jgi:hypothetical protein